MTKLILTLVLLTSLFGAKIELPFVQLQSCGGVVDLVLHDDKLYSATNAGCVYIFDMKTKDSIGKIEVDKITNFLGDVIDSKVYSVDVIKDKVLLLSQAEQGFRRVHIHMPDTMELIIPYTKKLYIAKAKFLDENTILLALLGNELISYDIKNKRENWKIQISQSKFSNFALNETKTQVIVADESGNLKLYNTVDGSLVRTFSERNLDNVFQVDYKNGVIATAGQDRKVVVYNAVSGESYFKTATFLIYSVGISPSAKYVGYSSDENNNIAVFDTKSKSEIGIFGGNKMTLSNILFINENEFLVSSDDSKINMYKIK